MWTLVDCDAAQCWHRDDGGQTPFKLIARSPVCLSCLCPLFCYQTCLPHLIQGFICRPMWVTVRNNDDNSFRLRIVYSHSLNQNNFQVNWLKHWQHGSFILLMLSIIASLLFLFLCMRRPEWRPNLWDQILQLQLQLLLLLEPEKDEQWISSSKSLLMDLKLETIASLLCLN